MIRAFQWDVARQVERLDFLKKLLPRYARWGFEELYLHLEDAVHYPSLPGVARADAYTYEEFGELVQCATDAGIRVVPIVNLLGHTQYLIKEPGLRDLNELRDANDQPLDRGQICPLYPRTREVAEKLLRDVLPFCTAGKVHVGLDESFHLGKCPRCREEVAKIGLGGHFAGHVQRLHRLCSKLDLQMGIWADMLYFVPEAISQLPRGITAYDWYYYSFAKIPRVEFFNYAERDLAPALKKQGIGYYGCPMNGAFRYEPLPVFGDRLGNIRSWWKRCLNIKADGFLITSWEANRLALETTTTVDAAAATLWLKPDADDATGMLADGLERVFKSVKSRGLARLLLAADEHAFAGYARWQINDRWDTFAGNESVKSYHYAERFFARLLKSDHPWPAAFSASLRFRHYLAKRDVFVRESARAVFKLRRLTQSGKSDDAIRLIARLQTETTEFIRHSRDAKKAVHAMSRRSRNPHVQGPNVLMLQADQIRSAQWAAWLKRVAKQPQRVWSQSILCGVWQLHFIVHNFAPASQKVAVEQQGADGKWEEIAGRYTIEFRSYAAYPQTSIRREFSVPISSPQNQLRIAVKGIGQVRISHVTLTNGVETSRAGPFRQQKILGHQAPKQGMPAPDRRPPSVMEIRTIS